ncbi:MAG: polysaccharide biosynthesis tyrosine autokinase [Alphaproteobacteria bacterium]|nr:MAG: polysaccharide biosynthesis tyrosine autokinase [Alphaproteobacteria bacterium]
MNEMASTSSATIGRVNGGAGDASLLVIRDVQENSTLVRYGRIARRWKWVIMGSIAAGVAAALIVTFMMTRQYSATTRIEIAREEARIVNIQGVQPEAGTVDQEFYQTQYGLLKSRALAERVARELSLADNRAFLDQHGITDTPGSLVNERPLDNSAGARQERLARVVGLLLDKVSVSPLRASRLVDVTYTDPDPAVAARVANAWGRLFIQSNIERRFEATAYARNFLERRLAELRQRLDESDRALVGYASAQRIININTPSGNGVTGERPITADDLVAYNTALAEARNQRITAESVLRGGAGAEQNVNNPTLGALRQRRAEVAAEHARLLTQFEAQYPAVEALAAQLRQLDRTIAGEERRVMTGLRSQVTQAAARETELAARVEALKTSLIDLRRRSIQYNILQREVDTNRTIYDGLLQRYKEIGIAGAVGTNNISIVDQARVPEGPSSPRPLINLLLGLMLGAGLGAALALALEQIDEAITDPGEMETLLGVPSLGVVPKVETGDPIETLQDRRSALTEAYLTIRTNLQFATPHGVPRSLMITSTHAAEGKSTTALALALVLARQGLRVLVVDSDMRSPSLHHRFKIGNEKGLSNILSGNARWNEVAQDAEFAGVKAITAGPHPPNSADLLSGPGLGTLLAELMGAFDHVIVDAPPMLGLADAPLVASKVGGVVYVVESFGVQSRSARIAINRLRNSGAHILGAVLTKFESKKAAYGYGYDYGYGYGNDKEA